MNHRKNNEGSSTSGNNFGSTIVGTNSLLDPEY